MEMENNPERMDSCFGEGQGMCGDCLLDSRPLVEYVELSRSDVIVSHIAQSEIIYLVKGRMIISLDNFDRCEIAGGNMILLPRGSQLRCKAESAAAVFVVRLRDKVDFCSYFSLGQLFSQFPRADNKIGTLALCGEIEEYFSYYIGRVKEGIGCPHFHAIKIRELCFLLGVYYPLRELSQFFSPLMSSDSTFTEFVLNNHRKVRTVIEFARMARYSLSGFEKRFRRVFGISPYRWMKQRRAQSILHDLYNGTKSFSQMKDEYGFSSLSHFNDFCKKNFGEPPGRIRRRGKAEQSV